MNALPSHRMEVHCQPSNPWREGISVYMTWILGDRRQLARPIVFEDVADGLTFEPTTVLGMAAAQQLMDGLWQCGLRPSEGTGSAGALAATQKHLEDMRTLVFNRNGG